MFIFGNNRKYKKDNEENERHQQYHAMEITTMNIFNISFYLI